MEESLARKERLSFAGWKVDDESTARVVRAAYNLKELDMYLPSPLQFPSGFPSIFPPISRFFSTCRANIYIYCANNEIKEIE